MTKPRVALILAAALLALLASIAVSFAQTQNFRWELSGTFTMNGAVVEGRCDGPHRIYIARVYGNADGLSPVALSVVKDGCLRTPAENPKAD